MKTLLIILLFLPLTLYAPESHEAIVFQSSGVNPYESLFHATTIVESSKNPLVINYDEMAYGLVQIRQVKLDDFNKQSGKHYSLEDCLDPGIAREIYMHFASKYGPMDLEIIARAWNGSGPMTDRYWTKIQKEL